MNSVNFAPKQLYFGNSKTSKPEIKEDWRTQVFKDIHEDSMREIRRNKRADLIGATIIGAVVAAGIGGVGVGTYKNYESQKLIQDMAEEFNQEDTKSLKIEDLNNDKMKEIIIEKTDGTKCIYDLKHNTIHFKVDDDMIEKIR